VLVRFERPERRVAPGQSVVLYRGDEVVGGGLVAADADAFRDAAVR
jgi:tRNA-specific 2-thiouridylase